MAALTPVPIALAGTLVALVAVNAAETVKQPSDQRLFLHVKNGSGSSINVTIAKALASITTPEAGTVARSDMVVAVAAGAEKLIGPFPPAFVDATGNVNIAYSATGTITAAVYSLPRVG